MSDVLNGLLREELILFWDTIRSLQITPACNFPLKCLRGGGKIAIVNLQVIILFPHAHALLQPSQTHTHTHTKMLSASRVCWWKYNLPSLIVARHKEFDLMKMITETTNFFANNKSTWLRI